MANRGELTLRLDYYVAPNDPGDELEQLRLAAEEVKQLPSNDMFRFAGFAATLIRHRRWRRAVEPKRIYSGSGGKGKIA